MIRNFQNALALLTLVMLAAALPGCGYTLRGKVVRGETSRVEMIHEIDQRMKGPGLDNVEVAVRRNPANGNSELVGRTRTNPSGDFSMHIGDFGAGWMQEQWLVQARLNGFQNANTLMKLPAKGSKWRLLITLAPGDSAPLDSHEEIIQDLEKFK